MKLTNHQILERYEKKLKRAKTRLDRALFGILNATNRMVRARNLVTYLDRQRARVLECCESGVPFRQEREKKAKPGRRIEL